MSAVPGPRSFGAPGAVAPEVEDEEVWAFWRTAVNSFVMIIVTELGDKTFFISCILAMRNGRMLVFIGSMGALAVMHVLSSVMGIALPMLLPKEYTHYASALLFVYFGVKMLIEARDAETGPSEELQEVEEELIGKKQGRRQAGEGDEEDGAASLGAGDEGVDDGAVVVTGDANGGSVGDHAPPDTPRSAKTQSMKVLMQALTLTFLAEWGDRSQIATIAMAAAHDPWGVIVGGVLGHAICTGIAVIGGRMLAARISERTVLLSGGILFLAFAVHAFVEGP